MTEPKDDVVDTCGECGQLIHTAWSEEDGPVYTVTCPACGTESTILVSVSLPASEPGFVVLVRPDQARLPSEATKLRHLDSGLRQLSASRILRHLRKMEIVGLGPTYEHGGLEVCRRAIADGLDAELVEVSAGSPYLFPRS